MSLQRIGRGVAHHLVLLAPRHVFLLLLLLCLSRLSLRLQTSLGTRSSEGIAGTQRDATRGVPASASGSPHPPLSVPPIQQPVQLAAAIAGPSWSGFFQPLCWKSPCEICNEAGTNVRGYDAGNCSKLAWISGVPSMDGPCPCRTYSKRDPRKGDRCIQSER